MVARAWNELRRIQARPPGRCDEIADLILFSKWAYRVSVVPAYQRQGIGKALIGEGLLRLSEMNAQGCCLVGHPDYYRKFGFKNISSLVLEGVPQEVFFALVFDGRVPQGTVVFHKAFQAAGCVEDQSTDANI